MARSQHTRISCRRSPQFAEGKLLYGRDRSLFGQDFSLRTFQVSGKPVKIADDVNTYHGRALASFSVSNSGLLAYRTSPVRFTEVAWLDRSGRIDVSFPATENNPWRVNAATAGRPSVVPWQPRR